jgi:hypothetical protein
MTFTAAAPVLGSLVNPADPYMLHSPFPWLMLAPLAVALQHGLWAGLTSSVLLSGLAGWQAMSSGSIPASFASWSVGCGITAMIDTWIGTVTETSSESVTPSLRTSSSLQLERMVQRGLDQVAPRRTRRRSRCCGAGRTYMPAVVEILSLERRVFDTESWPHGEAAAAVGQRAFGKHRPEALGRAQTCQPPDRR